MFQEASLETINFSVLTLNCWGIPIPYVVEDYKERMKAISETLFIKDSYDVVCLQEVWSCADFEFFQESAKNELPYSQYFHSGVMGSGVCVFSKWPILDVLFHKWQVNGYIHKIMHGDWYGGKGIGLCRLNVCGFKVNIYSCHTHAEYSNNTEYLAHQVVQAFDIAQFIRVTSDNVDLAVLAADLNSRPGEVCYRIIRNYAGLSDSFELSKLELNGTYDCLRNSYSNTRRTEVNPHGDRIDYILYKSGTNASVNCFAYDTPLNSRIPGRTFSYSDHEAIVAKFKISPSNHSEIFNDSFQNSVEALNAVTEGYRICKKAVTELENDIRIIKLIILLIIICLCVIISFYFLFFFTSELGFILSVFILVFVTFILFCVFLWKKIERNSILCSLSSMKIILIKQNKN